MVFWLTNDSLKQITFTIDFKDCQNCDWSKNEADVQQSEQRDKGL